MHFRTHQEKADASTLGLLALFAVLVVAIVVVVNVVLAGAYRLTFMSNGAYPAYFFATNTFVVLLFVLGGVGVESLRIVDGGPHVAKMAGARPAQMSSPNDMGRLERRFTNIVNEMAIASRMAQPPQAYVLHRDDAINAFAAGWSEKDHVIVVTRGALERLTREELQGVVAHEFAHLKHGDTRLNMRLIGLVWGLQMIHGFGHSLAEPDDHGAPPFSAVFGYALMGAGWFGWAAGRMLQAAVSRQREFNADASAVEFTRLVAGLGGALRKVAAQVNRATSPRSHDPKADMLRGGSSDTVAHLLLHHRSPWLATHPPIHQRLQRLFGRSMEPLADDVQPAPKDEHLLGFATGGPAQRHINEPSDAVKHDPLQPAPAKAAADSMRDAVARADRWRGPMEQRAALSGLLLDVDDADAWRAWEQRLSPPPEPGRYAAPSPLLRRIREDVQSLDLPTRLHVFASLVDRARSMPPREQAQLRQDARALTVTPLARLRRVALLRMLDRPVVAQVSPLAMSGSAATASAPQAPGFVQRPPAARRPRKLDQSLPAAVIATAALARLASPADPKKWLGAARTHLKATQIKAPPLPYWHMRQVLRVGPMERPQIMAAWMQATRSGGLMHDEGSREALALAALAMDMPTALA
jgi:Zn-dependent protease with chaperone function